LETFPLDLLLSHPLLPRTLPLMASMHKQTLHLLETFLLDLPLPHPLLPRTLPAKHTPAPVTAAGGINLGVIAGNQAGQHAQANVAAGYIDNPQVFPSGVCTSRNLDQVTLLAHMNQEVVRGIANLNSFLPRDDERRQTRLEAAITSANQRLSAAVANGRPTANIFAADQAP
jgi:hypothetical protein